MGIGLGRLGQRCGSLEGRPSGLQRRLRLLDPAGVFQIHVRPIGVGGEFAQGVQGTVHVLVQAGEGGQGVGPIARAQVVHALHEQMHALALHHALLLQVFHRLDAVGQAGLELRQGLFGQGRTGFGGVSDPGQGVPHHEGVLRQHLLGFVGPLGDQGLLVLLALEQIDGFLEHLGCAFVARAHLAMHTHQVCQCRLLIEPSLEQLRALLRLAGRKGTVGEGVQLGMRGGARRGLFV